MSSVVGGLVVDRYVGEKICIGDDIVVTLVETKGKGRARISVVAPRHIQIWRGEIAEKRKGLTKDVPQE